MRGILDSVVGAIMDRQEQSEPQAPKLVAVEQVRQRIARGQAGELSRLRIFLSSIDGNQHAVDSLRGEHGELLLADITELVLMHLGHTTELTRMQDGGNGRASQARKSVRGRL